MNIISKNLHDHYEKTLAMHGATPKGVDWRDFETANIRHHKISQIINVTDNMIPTLLDVGCGYGAFKNYADDNHIKIEYHGIDIVREMVEKAKVQIPDGKFIVGDFLQLENMNQNFDYIVCNGILTQKLNASMLDMEQYMKEVILKMYQFSNIGCAFNVMSTRVNYFSSNLFYQNPAELLSYCLSNITNNVKLDHSYGLYEFTVYLYK